MTAPVETPREQSWREIRQAVNPRTMTTQGRRRLGLNLLRAAGTVFTFTALAAAAVYLGQGAETPAEKLAPAMKAEPLRDVVVLTDGVLTKSWVMERLALPREIALVTVDLAAAKAALEAEEQVRAAVISRSFPDTLVVTLEERVPVARAMAALEPRRPEPLFVARDGVVYRGYHYDPAMVEQLPWLDGIRLTRHGPGFEPVDGMGRVADFLLAAQREAPHLATGFHIISLAEQPRLIVRSKDVPQIVFEPGNYRRQLARLDYIVDFYRQQPDARPFARIDVSIAAQVAVQFAPAAGARVPARGATTVAGDIRAFSIRNSSTSATNRGFKR